MKKFFLTRKFILSLTLVLLTAAVFSSIVISKTNAEATPAQDATGIRTIVSNASAQNYVTFKPNIEYTKVEDISLKLHLITPRDVKGPLPLIVYVQGSAWGPQNTFNNVPQLSELAKNGYVVATVQYRTSAQSLFPAQIQDVKTAIRFLKAHASDYKIDPNKVGVWGDSSGGHTASLVGTTNDIAKFEGVGYNDQSSKVQAVVDFYGPTDFLRMNDFPSDIDHNAANSPESRLIGGPIQENPEKAQEANPINYITSDDAPFLIMHGDQDRLMPYNQSVLLYNALKAADHEVTMYKVEGAGHGIGFSQPNIYDTVTKFFDNQLKK
jgi:acetyl esterase/lipase